MSSAEDRPDPDALLRRVQAETSDARASRHPSGEGEQGRKGRLRVFLGFAPGVGKTYRMLEAAHELQKHATSPDVVMIGVVETHNRAETRALLVGLPALSKRSVEYRSHTLEELNLEAALSAQREHSRTVLVDELAHTNAPGGRHRKRWQDVVELLDAGVDVLTTLNVQHIESLNDVVARITGIQVRETVPDSILERADEIELVDISPEELLQRLRDGKVYVPDQAARALDNFFQKGNLLALRELALRHAAGHVDHDVQEYRAQNAVEAVWQSGERILVCVGPSPASANLIRSAKRMATGLRATWVAAYVDKPAMIPRSAADNARLEKHLALTEALGGEVKRLVGSDIADSLLEFARKNHVTRIILGKPTHSRLLDRVRGSLLDEIVRKSVDLDVHVISGDSASVPGAAERSEELQADYPASVASYFQATLLVAVTTGVAALVQRSLGVPDVGMVFLLPVILTALRHGRGPSLLAAVLSIAAYDFFCVPPYLTFSVSDGRYLLTFCMMLGVGLTLSALTLRLRRHEKEARAREDRTVSLFGLTRELGGTLDEHSAAQVIVRHAGSLFGCSAIVFVRDEPGGVHAIAASPAEAACAPKDLAVVEWTLDTARAAGIGTDTLSGASLMCVPLGGSAGRVHALALVPNAGFAWGAEERTFLELFCRQAVQVFERVHLLEEAQRAQLRVRTEELRNSLLSSVSHDLRTPLASISGAATTLRANTSLPAETRNELLQSIADETMRLERLVSNLLDMTRLESGNVQLKREWVPLVEVIGSVLNRLEAVLARHDVRANLPDTLPLVHVDAVLLEQLFVNILENASKYAPAGSVIEIQTRFVDRVLEVDVLDRGPGVAPGEQERVFERFHRGGGASAPGAGLGLAIARGIATVHGGTLTFENRDGGGAMLRLRMPQREVPPSVSEDIHPSDESSVG